LFFKIPWQKKKKKPLHRLWVFTSGNKRGTVRLFSAPQWDRGEYVELELIGSSGERTKGPFK
jgi:hypothetical protein